MINVIESLEIQKLFNKHSAYEILNTQFGPCRGALIKWMYPANIDGDAARKEEIPQSIKIQNERVFQNAGEHLSDDADEVDARVGDEVCSEEDQHGIHDVSGAMLLDEDHMLHDVDENVASVRNLHDVSLQSMEDNDASVQESPASNVSLNDSEWNALSPIDRLSGLNFNESEVSDIISL